MSLNVYMRQSDVEVIRLCQVKINPIALGGY